MKSTPKVRQVGAKDEVRRVSLTRRWRSKRALRSAQLLDEVVDTQLPLLAAFDEERRRRSADYLAELVALAQDYRYYANGWIDSRELDRRGQRTMNRLARMREESSARLITD